MMWVLLCVVLAQSSPGPFYLAGTQGNPIQAANEVQGGLVRMRLDYFREPAYTPNKWGVGRHEWSFTNGTEVFGQDAMAYGPEYVSFLRVGDADTSVLGRPSSSGVNLIVRRYTNGDLYAQDTAFFRHGAATIRAATPLPHPDGAFPPAQTKNDRIVFIQERDPLIEGLFWDDTASEWQVAGASGVAASPQPPPPVFFLPDGYGMPVA